MKKNLMRLLFLEFMINMEHVVRYIKGRGGEVIWVTGNHLLVSTRRKAPFI